MAGQPKTRAARKREKPPDPLAADGGYATVSTMPQEQAAQVLDQTAGLPVREPINIESIRAARVVPYDADKAEVVLMALAEGATIAKAAALAGIPSSTPRSWMAKRPDFAVLWGNARAEGAHQFADRVAEVSERVSNGMDPQAGRVIIDAYKWLASKFLPKAYGDRLELNATVHNAGPDLSNWPTECLLEVEAVLSRYGLALDGSRIMPDAQSIPGEVIASAVANRPLG